MTDNVATISHFVRIDIISGGTHCNRIWELSQSHGCPKPVLIFIDQFIYYQQYGSLKKIQSNPECYHDVIY